MLPEPTLRLSRSLWTDVTRELHRRTKGSHESGAFLLGGRSGSERTATAVIYYDDLDPRAYDTGVCVLEAEARGFRTAIVERNFGPDFRINSREPSVALIGVDNALTRQAIEDVGFDRVIEAGLGRGPQDFLGINVHTFPASTTARTIWRQTETADIQISQPAYRAMLELSGDRCGTVRLAGRSIGAPFVGAVASALAIAELLRLVIGGRRYEFIACHLRDLTGRTVVRGQAWDAFNPGSVTIAA